MSRKLRLAKIIDIFCERSRSDEGKSAHWNFGSHKSTAHPSHRLLYIAFVFLVRLKSFRRWMSETCLPCPPTKFPDNNEPYIFSFYEDIVQVNRHFSSYFFLPSVVYGAALVVSPSEHKNIGKSFSCLNLQSREKCLSFFNSCINFLVSPPTPSPHLASSSLLTPLGAGTGHKQAYRFCFVPRDYPRFFGKKLNEIKKEIL